MNDACRLALAILSLLNGVFFASNIYVFGRRTAAIRMHSDLAPDASAAMANMKVSICFLTGCGYVAAALGLFLHRYAWCLAGWIGAGLFLGLYAVELILWARTHRGTIYGFCVFGGLSTLIGAASLWAWLGRN